MKLALVVPHIFFHQDILPDVIFSPGELVISLVNNLARLGEEVSIFSPGPIDKLLPNNTHVKNITVDLSLFEQELKNRGDNYLDLLMKHPLTFITLARQVQTELISKAFTLANQDQFDLVHIWCNEEEQALAMATLCHKPVVFNHHEPFNFLARYRAIFPKYLHLNWISFSKAQRTTFICEKKVNWVGNVYHGLETDAYQFSNKPGDYLLYMGRIIKPKGVHYAIEVAKKTGIKLKIVGKHYAGHSKDRYWQEFIQPEIDGEKIEYLGFIKDSGEKQQLYAGAKALLVPSTWQEPFGLVMIEAMACGTPVIGFDQGAVPEVIKDEVSGYVVKYLTEKRVVKADKLMDQDWHQLQKDKQFQENVEKMTKAVIKINNINRASCRSEFEKRFSANKMAEGYRQIYLQLLSLRLSK